MSGRLSLLAVTLAAALAAAAPAPAAPGDMALVSRSPSAVGDNTSVDPAISADGRYVAFTSWAGNFAPGVSTGLYVKDLATGALELVSRADGADGAPGVMVARPAAISDDGRYVAFQTADALDPATDTDGGHLDIYVRDRVAHDTILAGVDSDEAPLPGDMYVPALSGDGRHVAFEAAGPGSTLVVVRHLATGTTETASLQPDGLPANVASYPSISADGTRVAFTSNDQDLSPDDEGMLDDVFVRDLTTDTTILVSRTDADVAINGHSTAPRIAANGRHVVFKTAGSNLPTGNWPLQLYVRDIAAGTTTLVTQSSGGAAANGGPMPSSDHYSISADGRRVAWSTPATNLDPADLDPGEDVYVRDTVSRETWLVSRAAGNGPRGDGVSVNAAIDPSGAFVAFDSTATNFSAEDSDARDVFRRELPPVPVPPASEPEAPASPTAPPAVAPAPPAAVPPGPPVVTTRPSGAVVRATDIVVLPSTRKCVSRRRLRITIRRPAGVTVREIRVAVPKRKTLVIKGSRLRAPVDLRGLPRGTFRVKVTVRLADGRTLTIARTYRTCRPKR